MLDSGSIQMVGQIVPDYELLRRIGGGAYGEVWLARSKATGILRAAKIVWRHTFDDDRPFQREFEGIQRFERISREHPSQLSLFHIGRNDGAGYFYYVMELADNFGTAADYVPYTLRADLGKGRLLPSRVLEIGLALAEALSHLHQNGLVHRDVKPSNVIFVNGRPKLADIGLVTDASDTRSIVGTEGYLAPEGPGTPQADIFALGKVLYEAVTGLDRRSFPELPQELKDWPDAAHVLEINEVILRSCDPSVAQRYAACDQIRADLDLIQSGQSVRRKRTRQQHWAAGKRIGAGLGSAAVIAGLIVAAWPRQPGRSGPSSDGPDSTNLEATAHCDKAMNTVRGDNPAEFLTAYSNFTKAISLDPNFVRPYVGLLELETREDVYIPGLPDATSENLRQMARRLEQLAPNLGATHIAKAVVSCLDWDFAEGLNQATEATKADPTYEACHTCRASFLYCFGWPEEARKELEISKKLARSKAVVYRCLGQVEFVERHYIKAIYWYKIAMDWESHHWATFRYMGQAYEALGDYTNAFYYFERADILAGADEVETKKEYAAARRVLDTRGIDGYWQNQWLETEKYPDRDFHHKAIVQIHLGHTNDALNWLEKECETRASRKYPESPLMFLWFDEYWDGLHDNPRFRKLLDELGYTKVLPPRNR